MFNLTRGLEPVDDAGWVEVVLTFGYPNNKTICVEMLHTDNTVLLLKRFFVEILNKHAVVHFHEWLVF